jgi:hypothetical protein
MSLGLAVGHGGRKRGAKALLSSPNRVRRGGLVGEIEMAWEEKNANLIETIAPASRASAPTRKMRSTRPSRIRFRRPTRFQRSSRFRPARIVIEQRPEDLEGGGGAHGIRTRAACGLDARRLTDFDVREAGAARWVLILRSQRRGAALSPRCRPPLFRRADVGVCVTYRVGAGTGHDAPKAPRQSASGWRSDKGPCSKRRARRA